MYLIFNRNSVAFLGCPSSASNFFKSSYKQILKLTTQWLRQKKLENGFYDTGRPLTYGLPFR
jgi:hypothetical protein